MIILQIASEIAPIAKVGGLGDVVLGLSRALIEQGHSVEVIIPKYAFIDKSIFDSFDDKNSCGFFQDVKIFLFSPEGRDFFNRDKVYGYEDDCERFISFCYEVKKDLANREKKPDVIHIHDWHTSSLALFVKNDAQTMSIKTILTIHNMQHQGICSIHLLKKFVPITEDSQNANLLQKGIKYSDKVVTVSPTYSREVMKSEKGYGMQSILIENKSKFCGILNGIDTGFWDPLTDKAIPQNYSSCDDVAKILQCKKESKKELYNFFAKNLEMPLFACITRLDYQKGMDLIEKCISFFGDKGTKAQFMLLGISCLPSEEDPFPDLARKFHDDKKVKIHLQANDAIARRLYSGANFIIVPSRFEPCGLTQMIGCRYGTIPIVRKTGGLADTIFDIDDDAIPKKRRNGFVFENSSWEELQNVLQKAINLYYNDPAKYKNICHNVMKVDFSWVNSSKEYCKIYQT